MVHNATSKNEKICYLQQQKQGLNTALPLIRTQNLIGRQDISYSILTHNLESDIKLHEKKGMTVLETWNLKQIHLTGAE